jgi:hypothetical protein
MADSFSAYRRHSISIFLLPLIALASAIWVGDCPAQMYYNTAPSYYPYTIARPQDRTWIRSLPMEQRPNRPLHFYGNMVRRSYSVQRPSYGLQTQIQTAPVRATPTVNLQFGP